MLRETIQLVRIYHQKKQTKTRKEVLLRKNKKYFENTVDLFSNREEWDVNKFIKCMFDYYGDIWPAQLPQEKNWKIYIEYKNKYEKNIYKEIAEELLSTYNRVKIATKGDYKKYFEEKRHEILRGNTSVLFFLFCKSFYSSFSEEEINKIYGENKDIELRKNYIKTNKKIINKLKEVLNDDFC